MIHLMLDEMLTWLIVKRLDPEGDEAVIIVEMVAGLFFERRVRLAVEARWIPKKLARDLRAVNRLRTALVRFYPRHLRDGRPPEIMSRNAFIGAWNLGVGAVRDLQGILRPAT